MDDGVRIPVRGMTCHACVARITRAVRAVEGVEWVQVRLEPDEVRVRFDPTRASLDALGTAIAAAGYVADTASAEAIVRERRRGWLARFGTRS